MPRSPRGTAFGWSASTTWLDRPAVIVRRWASAVRAFAACALVVVGPAGCDDYSGGPTTSSATQHVLRVQANGAGSGTVTSLGASPQISCTSTGGALSGACGVAYPTNSTVQLLATPNAASIFVGWSGSCVGTEQCVVDMSEERTVTASFARASPETSTGAGVRVDILVR